MLSSFLGTHPVAGCCGSIALLPGQQLVPTDPYKDTISYENLGSPAKVLSGRLRVDRLDSFSCAAQQNNPDVSRAGQLPG